MRAITALALSLAASLAAAQEVSAPTPLQVQVPTSGKSVSGRVSQPANTLVPMAQPTTSAAAASAHPSVAAPVAATVPGVPEPEAQTPVAPATAVTTSAAVEQPQATEWESLQEIIEPIVRNPLTGAGALLALMLLMAVLAYRRNQRNDALVTSSPQRQADATATPEAAGDLLPPTRGLQAEILALDLELGGSGLSSPAPSFAPAYFSANSTFEPVTPMVPSAEDLSLSKLQLAQKLLAAGENELARVLLTSVAETLHGQLQSQLHLRGDSPQGPRQ